MTHLERIPDSLVAQAAASVLFEANPISRELPESFDELPPDVKAFHREQAEVLRATHNKTQAGDSTFPWDLVTQISDTPEYTPGSLGRFYHESMGMILARYVRFDQMMGHAFYCVPLGRLTSESQVSWTVTNDLTKSSAFAVVGMAAGLTHPTDGQYGWAIVSGPNLSSIKTSDSNVNIANGLAWSATGEVSSTAAGRVLCRVIGSATVDIPPGQAFIEIESWSAKAIEALVEAQYTTFDLRISGLTTRIAAVELALGVLGDDTAVTGITTQLTKLRADLTAETRSRINQGDELHDLITGGNWITGSELTASLDTLSASLILRINGVSTTAETALTNSLTALTRLDALPVVDLTLLEEAIGLLNGRVTTLSFLALADTPDTYAGSAGYVARVNGTEDGLEFAPIVGLPAGGTTGQALLKDSNTDFDATWHTLTASGIAFTPAGGLASTEVQSALLELDTEKQASIGYVPVNRIGDTMTGLLTLNSTYAGTTTAATLRGFDGQCIVTNTGNVTALATFRSRTTISSAAVIAASICFSCVAPTLSGGGTITTQYGVFIGTMKQAGVTNGYGIFHGSAVDYDVFGNRVRIGSTVDPTEALDVTGNAKISGTLAISGLVSSAGLEPIADNIYYLGRRDDDSPKAWKGLVLKDQVTGTYYSAEVISGVLTLIDLTD